MQEETNKILNESEEIALLTSGRGWELIKKYVKDILLRFDSVNAIDFQQSPEEIKIQALSNKKVVEEFISFINHFESFAEKKDTIMELLEEARNEKIIVKLED